MNDQEMVTYLLGVIDRMERNAKIERFIYGVIVAVAVFIARMV